MRPKPTNRAKPSTSIGNPQYIHRLVDVKIYSKMTDALRRKLRRSWSSTTDGGLPELRDEAYYMRKRQMEKQMTARPRHGETWTKMPRPRDNGRGRYGLKKTETNKPNKKNKATTAR